MPEAEKSQVYEAMWQTIGSQLPATGALAQNKKHCHPFQVKWIKTSSASLVKIAACFLLVLAGLVGTRHWYTHNQQAMTIQPNVKWQEVASPIGRKAVITLPDGSTAHLNAGSKLTYPTEFALDKRTVLLEGEAYFEVEKDSQRPFSVQSGELITTVLGTRFNVKAYRDEQYVRVAVVEGKVAVKSWVGSNHAVKGLLLLPNEQATYTNASRALEKQTVVASQIVGWKEGTLVLNDSTFEASTRVLERWYGVTFVFGEERLKRRKLAASFERASLQQVVQALSLSLAFRYTIDGDTVRIGATQ